ncbi:MAG TPA: polyprenyl diphosphate synthase [Bacteroidales bacterium]|jgi:undecaprenyl diphosphate synthase|nr:polyprenyl diphosphate synthase [Bacteroidales bacterium]HPB89204.1 polyprenyl diphosphate synthase [Bacteroidales bacterium]HPH54090.1 polyprenyl diphosphate synthase [Bacteroidales bacterium]HPY22295.1 polyprenyl diphosphate synthase [Bacteroidales bacterium]HQA93112.1 polyprenyl diphosphate synthase [Bacteroidales bacterium]
MTSEIINIPTHVSIIMDGNGRWARKKGHERLFGHNAGVDSVRTAVEYAREKGIRYLSLFAFSEENWGRPDEEVSGLMALMAKAVAEERATFAKYDIRFRIIGNRKQLPEDLVVTVEELEAETLSNSSMDLIIMLSYSGRWDILQAAYRYGEICANAAREGLPMPSLDQDSFSCLLSTDGIPDPDLIIRTSGEQRISNYMLWQAAYTEFYITEVLWPDFRKNDFERALISFNNRQRRFGKLK